jgi:hypothetical protein
MECELRSQASDSVGQGREGKRANGDLGVGTASDVLKCFRSNGPTRGQDALRSLELWQDTGFGGGIRQKTNGDKRSILHSQKLRGTRRAERYASRVGQEMFAVFALNLMFPVIAEAEFVDGYRCNIGVSAPCPVCNVRCARASKEYPL